MLEITAGENAESFLSDTLLLCQELLSDIFVNINSMKSFSAEFEFSWNIQLAKLMDKISRFVEITTLVSKFTLNNHVKLFSSAKQSHIHLLFIMKGINQAQQKQDTISLEELIKYELKDNLTMWKIDLLPQTKRLLNA